MSDNPTRTPIVVVGIDGSEDAMHAAAWAADEARCFGATLSLVHALESPLNPAHPAEPPPHDERRRAQGVALLEQARDRLTAGHPGLEISKELSARPPAETLIDLSRRCDLLVMGTRGHGGFTGMMLGSVSNHVATDSRCPLIVVHGAQPRPSPGEIVLGLDVDEAPEPIDFALRAASVLGRGVRAVRAFDPRPPAYEGGREAARLPQGDRDDVERAMERLLTLPQARYRLSVSREAHQGHPVPVLIEAARGAHLIVVGSHRRRPPYSFGPGHIVHGLLSHSDTPVAVVPIP